jgi:hypothetical protein
MNVVYISGKHICKIKFIENKDILLENIRNKCGDQAIYDFNMLNGELMALRNELRVECINNDYRRNSYTGYGKISDYGIALKLIKMGRIKISRVYKRLRANIHIARAAVNQDKQDIHYVNVSDKELEGLRKIIKKNKRKYIKKITKQMDRHKIIHPIDVRKISNLLDSDEIFHNVETAKYLASNGKISLILKYMPFHMDNAIYSNVAETYSYIKRSSHIKQTILVDILFDLLDSNPRVADIVSKHFVKLFDRYSFDDKYEISDNVKLHLARYICLNSAGLMAKLVNNNIKYIQFAKSHKVINAVTQAFKLNESTMKDKFIDYARNHRVSSRLYGQLCITFKDIFVKLIHINPSIIFDIYPATWPATLLHDDTVLREKVYNIIIHDIKLLVAMWDSIHLRSEYENDVLENDTVVCKILIKTIDTGHNISLLIHVVNNRQTVRDMIYSELNNIVLLACNKASNIKNTNILSGLDMYKSRMIQNIIRICIHNQSIFTGWIMSDNKILARIIKCKDICHELDEIIVREPKIRKILFNVFNTTDNIIIKRSVWDLCRRYPERMFDF